VGREGYAAGALRRAAPLAAPDPSEDRASTSRTSKEINLPKLLRMARASGRGIGKSALVAWLALVVRVDSHRRDGIISANTEDQLRKITFAELNKWKTMAINAHWWDVVGITMKPARVVDRSR
jgi:hypothetical protein